jgi:hypothetical protein
MNGLSPEFRQQAGVAMDDYIDAVINDEWKVIGYGRRSEKVQALAAKVWELYGNYQPQTETQKIFLAESVRKMNERGDETQRLMDASRDESSSLMVLIIGGCITIAFTFFFGRII